MSSDLPTRTSPPPPVTLVAASAFDWAALADIYNRTRIDYIVPMPLNARRMADYVRDYDVALDASVVAIDAHDDTPVGIGMLGLRRGAAWLTRLGVDPARRGQAIGTLLMEALLGAAVGWGAASAQLEVIVGNTPAEQLFTRFGFAPTRLLRVVRRPPGPPAGATTPYWAARPLDADEVMACLTARTPGASWVEDSASLVNAGHLAGLALVGTAATAWAVFQATRLQLQHIVLAPSAEDDPHLADALLWHIHQAYADRDTKVENIPSDHPTWPAFTRAGYVVAFERTEMWRALG